MKYLKKFNNEEEFQEFIKSSDYIRPNVSLCLNEDIIHFDDNPPPQYLTFKAVSANSTVKLNRMGTATTLPNAVLQYSTDDGETWNDYTFTKNGNSNYSGLTITLSNVGDSVKFKGNNGSFGINSSNYHQFKMTGKISAEGDITSLNNEVGGNIPLSAYCYYRMFQQCKSLTDAPELHATTLAEECYRSMFNACTSLTDAPELPATTLARNCYNSMFYGCTSLTAAPELPATTSYEGCYTGMFQQCTSLTAAPELPATTLASTCYSNMFQGCTSLTAAPELPATTLVGYCYSSMFQDCDKLSYIKAMFTTEPSKAYTNNWVSGVASAGTFVKNSAASWDVTGVNGIPTNWTIETANS